MTQPFRNPLDESWWRATVYGEPSSKANSRRLVNHGGVPRFIKAKKAIDYTKSFSAQLIGEGPSFEGDVAVAAKIYYRTRRPDLDESLILDSLQGFAFHNDRQVKAKLILWGLDKENPRTEVFVGPVETKDEAFSRFLEYEKDGII